MRRNFGWILTALLMMVAAGCGSDDSGSNNGFDPHENTQLDSGTDVLTDAGPQGSTSMGGPCTSDADCADGRCVQGEPFGGGYCTTVDDCQFDTDCPDGSSCLPSDQGPICANRCSDDSDCRDGYACQDSLASAYDVCSPVVEPAGLDDGEACAGDDDCRGGTCIPDPRWPGGYCTTLDCNTQEDCARGEQDNRCLTGGQGYNFCVRMCDTADDCRDGYVCQPVGGGEGFCAPDRSVQLGLDDTDAYPFDITCGLTPQNGEVAIDYDIAEDTVAYMVTPLARDGRRLTPTTIDLPDQSEISFGRDNDFQTIPSQLFGFINPIVTPVIDAFGDQLQAGAHTLHVRTDSQDICYYLLQENSYGTTIDFNIYLVGVPDMDAASAPDNPDMQAVLERFGDIYTQAGISLGDINYYDVTGEDAQAYQVVRSETDIQELVATTTRPDGDYDRVLSANIFFVRSMQLGGMGGGGGSAIGISEGIPGAAGLHGTPTSGVVFTSEYMGETAQTQSGETLDGNQLTGVVMAHEVGHYLGLFHTSEQYGQGYDPLDDTPQCSSGFPDNCPDLDNLMFPLAGTTHTTLSDGQVHTIKANPLTKE